MKASLILKFFLSSLASSLLFVACQAKADLVPTHEADDATEVSIINADLDFTLKTVVNDGKLAYVGVGGDIDGVINPDLIVQKGDIIHVTLVNGDGMQHDLFFPDLNAKAAYVSKIGDQAEIVFEAGDLQPGTYAYYCTVPGHRQAGQEGKLIVTER